MIKVLVKIVAVSAFIAHNATAAPLLVDSHSNDELIRLFNQFGSLYNQFNNDSSRYQRNDRYSTPKTYPQHAFPDNTPYDADTEAFIERYRGKGGQVFLKNF